jgi:hypothetical protein
MPPAICADSAFRRDALFGRLSQPEFADFDQRTS